MTARKATKEMKYNKTRTVALFTNAYLAESFKD